MTPRASSKSQLMVRSMPERRHMLVKGFLEEYWQREVPSISSLPWSAADAGALGQFLKANPGLTVEQIAACLTNRLASEDHAPGERVHVWINSLLRYASGPLDRYKLPKASTKLATVGIHDPANPPRQQPISKESIRQQMGEQWFSRVRERREAGKPLSDMDKDCLREEGLL